MKTDSDVGHFQLCLRKFWKHECYFHMIKLNSDEIVIKKLKKKNNHYFHIKCLQQSFSRIHHLHSFAPTKTQTQINTKQLHYNRLLSHDWLKNNTHFTI
jgi:hypothetical protein